MTSIPVAVCWFSDKYFKGLFLKNKCFFSIFDSISEMCMKFKTFWKKKSILA